MPLYGFRIAGHRRVFPIVFVVSAFFFLLCSSITELKAQDHLRAFRFVENIGQWEQGTAFQGFIGEAMIRFSPTDVSYWYPVQDRSTLTDDVQGYTLQTRFLHANPRVRISGDMPAGGIYNYYLGPDPDRQFHDARDYHSVHYTELYRKIDAVFSGQKGQLKYDFVVRPGGNPQDILVSYEGAKGLRISETGELEVTTEFGTVREAAPFTYQIVDGKRKQIQARYRLTGKNTYGFSIGEYDRTRTLTIDPCLSIEYLTFLGAGGYDEVTSMAVDSAGNGYAVGITRALNFPTIPRQNPLPPQPHAFISKITPDGSALIYSTVFGPEYLGTYATGTINIFEALGEDVEITPDGKAVAGFTTNLTGLTTTGGAYQATHSPNYTSSACQIPPTNNYDTYIFRLGNTGALEWATYLGGSDDDYLRDIAIDPDGNIAITGTTHALRCGNIGDPPDFPVTLPLDSFSTTNPLKGFETFVSRLSADGTDLQFSALYGGEGNDFAGSIATGSTGDIYILGSTNSPDLKTTTGAFRETPDPGLSSTVYDVYLARISPTTGTLVYSTYIGDNGGAGRRGLGYGSYTDRRNFGLPIGGLEREGRYQDMLLENDDVVILGGTSRTTTLPATSGALMGSPGNPGASDSSAYDAYIIRFDMAGNRIANATYLGGSGFDALGGLAFDNEGNIAAGVSTSSQNYPLTRLNVQNALRGTADGALTVLNPGLGGLEYSTYVGGAPSSGSLLWEQSVTGVIADNSGAVYVFGGTVSWDLPYTPNALSKENDYHGGWIAKFVAPAIPRIGVPLTISFTPQACAEPQIQSQIIFNSGQAPLTIDSLRFKEGLAYTILNLPPLPFTLQPCDSLSLQLAFDPYLDESIACDKAVKDTLLIVSSNAAIRSVKVPVSGRKSCVSFRIRDRLVEDPSYQLGSGRGYNLLAFVNGDISQYVTITPLPGSSPYISPRVDWDRREISAGVTSIDFGVDPPDTGYFCASFLVQVEPCDRRDTINICSYVRSGFFNILPDSLNLGVIGCNEVNIPTKIWNSGNDTLEFKLFFVGDRNPEDIRYDDDDVLWDSTKYLAPGDTFSFTTIYRPGGVGQRAARPVFETNELRDPTPSHIFMAELDTVQFKLSLNDLEGAYDDVLDLPVQFEPIRTGRAPLIEITFLAKFDPNALAIAGIESEGTLTEGWEVAESRLTNEGRIIRLVMGDGGKPLEGAGSLARLKMLVLRGDTIGSDLDIALEGISLGCLYADVEQDYAFKLSEECLAHERLIMSGNRMLKRPYPNPARSQLFIPFRVPEDGEVTITIYDITGRVVAVPLHRSMSEGNNELMLNTGMLAPGRYFCRMVVGDVLTDTREIMIAE